MSSRSHPAPARQAPAPATAAGSSTLVVVDLNRCQSYGQCVFAAPDVFRMEHDETLEWDYAPDPAEDERVLRALHACPVQAIALTPAGAQR